MCVKSSTATTKPVLDNRPIIKSVKNYFDCLLKMEGKNKHVIISGDNGLSHSVLLSSAHCVIWNLFSFVHIRPILCQKCVLGGNKHFDLDKIMNTI